MKEKKERKIKEVAALHYSPEEDEAPRIVALGKGDIAEKILETAKDSDIPIYENSKLAHTLNSLNIGDEIPHELYEVVAEILVFVNSMDREFVKKYGENKHV